jgi:exosortase
MIERSKADVIQVSATALPRRGERTTFWLALGFFVFLWGVLCWFLGAEWTINDQYNYGWFVPFLALYLFWTRWESRPPSLPPLSGRRLRFSLFVGGLLLLFLLPLRLFEVGNPDWRLLGWLHAFVAAIVTLLALWNAGGKPWMRHFAFPIAFFFVAVPWLLTFEVPLVQVLMRIVAMGASEAATLCGIPAEFEGNLIRLNTGVVGVNEACSGVRSLQTSLMIGLLFGDLCRLTIARRVWLVMGALAIAIIANFARAFFLVWVAADQGLSGVDRWHDFAGYFILGAVFIGSTLLAAGLNRRQRKESLSPAIVPPTESPARDPSPTAVFPAGLILSALAWLLLVEIGVEAWYRVQERSLATQTPWSVQWPSTAPAKLKPIDERVKRLLRFNEGGSAEWPVTLPAQSSARALLYFFRWEAGSTSIIRARGHRPDICLPSSGWRLAADHGLRYYKAAENFALPFRHYSFVREEEGRPVVFGRAFFCVHEDRVRQSPPGAAPGDATAMEVTQWMIAERCKIVWEGSRNPGQQVLELILISRQEIPVAAAEASFSELLPSLVRLGDGNPPPPTSR